jgi:hypothetical protein
MLVFSYQCFSTLTYYIMLGFSYVCSHTGYAGYGVWEVVDNLVDKSSYCMSLHAARID